MELSWRPNRSLSLFSKNNERVRQIWSESQKPNKLTWTGVGSFFLSFLHGSLSPSTSAPSIEWMNWVILSYFHLYAKPCFGFPYFSVFLFLFSTFGFPIVIVKCIKNINTYPYFELTKMTLDMDYTYTHHLL